MDIQAQRAAICAAESAIENALDVLADESGLQAKTIKIQTVWDDNKNIDPAVKVNIEVGRHVDRG